MESVRVMSMLVFFNETSRSIMLVIKLPSFKVMETETEESVLFYIDMGSIKTPISTGEYNGSFTTENKEQYRFHSLVTGIGSC